MADNHINDLTDKPDEYEGHHHGLSDFLQKNLGFQNFQSDRSTTLPAQFGAARDLQIVDSSVAPQIVPGNNGDNTSPKQIAPKQSDTRGKLKPEDSAPKIEDKESGNSVAGRPSDALQGMQQRGKAKNPDQGITAAQRKEMIDRMMQDLLNRPEIPNRNPRDLHQLNEEFHRALMEQLANPRDINQGTHRGK